MPATKSKKTKTRGRPATGKTIRHLPNAVYEQLNRLARSSDIPASEIYKRLKLADRNISLRTLKYYLTEKRRELGLPSLQRSMPTARGRRLERIALAFLAILNDSYSPEFVDKVLLKAIELRKSATINDSKFRRTGEKKS